MAIDNEHDTWPTFGRVAALLGVAGLAIGVGVFGGFEGMATPIGLLLGIVATVFTISTPTGALVAWVLVLILRPTDFFPAVADYHPAMKLGALTGLLLVTSKFVRRDFRYVASKHSLWMLALAAAVLLSALTGLDRDASLIEFKGSFVKVLAFWFLALNVLTTRRRLVVFQAALGLAVAVLGGWALYFGIWGPPTPASDEALIPLIQLLGDSAYLLSEQAQVADAGRAFLIRGLLEDPNDLALVQLMGAPFLIEAWLSARGPKRWFIGLLALLPVGGILATQSRGGLLGLGAGIFLIIQGRSTSKVRPALAVGVFLAGAVAVSGIGERSSGGTAESGIDMSAQGRLDAWRAGANMVRYHPLTGVGFQNFGDYYMQYAIDPAEWLPGKAAHNAVVQCVAETGLLGLVPFLALFFRSARVDYALRERAPPKVGGAEAALLRSQFATLAAVGVAAMFLSMAWHYYLYILFVQAAAAEWVFSESDEASVVVDSGPDGDPGVDSEGEGALGVDAGVGPLGDQLPAVGGGPTR